MPLADLGFLDRAGRPDPTLLVGAGPTIEVVVSTLAMPDGLPPPTRTTHALVDTGAAQSCIDNDLARELVLPVIDRMTVSGAAGARQHDVYAVRVEIPSLEVGQFGAFAGVDLAAGGQPHGILLGRTFLQGTVMIYDGIRAQVTIASTRMNG